jgi:purine nucleoside phosphorylase
MIGGDLLSTALYPRVIYARELGMCFGSLAWISDMAGKESAHEWFMLPTEELRAILERALQAIPREAHCKCQSHYQLEVGRLVSSFWGAQDRSPDG